MARFMALITAVLVEWGGLIHTNLMKGTLCKTAKKKYCVVIVLYFFKD